MCALRVCIRMYRTVQYLIISPFVAAPVRAKVGVVAGCEFVTTWIKVYTLELMLEAIADVAYYVPPQVVTNADLYIDDLQIDIEADSELEAKDAFSDKADVFLDMIQGDICADLAHEKAAVVAAAPGDRRSDRLARAVRRRLGKAGGGIDIVAGRLRARWAGRLRPSSTSVCLKGSGVPQGQQCSGSNFPIRARLSGCLQAT